MSRLRRPGRKSSKPLTGTVGFIILGRYKMKMLFWSGILSFFFGFFTPEAEAKAWSRSLVQESSGGLDPQAILEQGLEDLIADPAQAVPDGGRALGSES